MKKLLVAAMAIPTLAGCSGDVGMGGGLSPGGTQTDTAIEWEPGQLTAGEWNDNEDWKLWLDLIHGDGIYATLWRVQTGERLLAAGD